MENHRIDSVDAIYTFILAGAAIFTIRNSNTGGRFTYKVRAKEIREGKTLWFVSVLTGADNDSDYSFLGTIFDDGIYRHGKKSRISREATSSKAFNWLMGRLDNHTDLGPVEFWHEGRCGRCGRTLTTPESIEIGLGPVCRAA
jgi:Family of unknown function (DUF6011)